MSESVDHGITVTTIAAMGQPIDVSPETTAAFVGRALRGPVNTPVLIKSLAEYRRRFGETWSRSSLGPAVQQFFAHGGNRLYVVRVASRARGAMVCLPARGSALVLRAVEPGSTETIRAAVDYDRIDANDGQTFNLTLQRINPVTRLIEDQELLSGVSYEAGAGNFVGDALLTSTLARLEYPYPTHRPEQTLKNGDRFESDYIGHVQAGTDGVDLTDYDLIGSRSAGTGLFALQEAESFDLLYLPPPSKRRDLGPAAVLAAERYCRERRAMLLIDPPAAWRTARQAVSGVNESGYKSANMMGYFPRVVVRETDAGRPHAAGGAIAGMLCRHDRTRGVWQQPDSDGMPFHQQLLPAAELDAGDSELLRRAGLNVIAKGSAGRARLSGSVTMGRRSSSHRDFASLSVRRFCLRIINAVAAGTRWAVFETVDDDLARSLCAQVSAYFVSLAEMGAFADERFVVECDAGVSRRADSDAHGVTLLLVFHPVGSAHPISLTLHLTPAGCRVGSTAFAPTLENCA